MVGEKVHLGTKQQRIKSLARIMLSLFEGISNGIKYVSQSVEKSTINTKFINIWLMEGFKIDLKTFLHGL